MEQETAVIDFCSRRGDSVLPPLFLLAVQVIHRIGDGPAPACRAVCGESALS